MKELKKLHLSSKTFLLLLLSCTLPYIIHALYIIQSGGYALWTYSNESIKAGMLGSIVPYVKDIAASLLFIILVFNGKRKTFSIASIYYFIFTYGTLVLLISGNFTIGYILAGMRSYLFIIVSVMFCTSMTFYEEEERRLIYEAFFAIVRVAIVIQLTLVLIQVLRSGSISYFGAGAYRFSGAFGNSGSLGSFCIASAAYLCIIGCKYKDVKLIEGIVFYAMILFTAVGSGMRSAMLQVAMFFCIYIITIIYELFKINKKTIIYAVIAFAMIFGGTLLNYIILRTDRGQLDESGSYRIDVFFQLLNNSNIFKLIFGQGIGFGTNAAINLGIKSATVFDGTLNTIIGQFGILGLIIFCMYSLILFYKICKKSFEYNAIAIGIIVSVVITFVSGNFFEQIPMVVIYVFSIFLLIDEKAGLDMNTKLKTRGVVNENNYFRG